MLVKKRRGLARGGDQERTCLDKSRFIGTKHSICTVTPRKKKKTRAKSTFHQPTIYKQVSLYIKETGLLAMLNIAMDESGNTCNSEELVKGTLATRN